MKAIVFVFATLTLGTWGQETSSQIQLPSILQMRAKTVRLSAVGHGQRVAVLGTILDLNRVVIPNVDPSTTLTMPPSIHSLVRVEDKKFPGLALVLVDGVGGGTSLLNEAAKPLRVAMNSPVQIWNGVGWEHSTIVHFEGPDVAWVHTQNPYNVVGGLVYADGRLAGIVLGAATGLGNVNVLLPGGRQLNVHLSLQSTDTVAVLSIDAVRRNYLSQIQ